MAQILVVDDDPDLNKLIALILRVDGYDVRQAAEGETALRMVQESAPDLILLDMMMPGMSGIDVARALHDTPQTTHIPVVFCSAKCDQDSYAEGLAIPQVVDYVFKPFAPQDLLSRLHNVLH